MAEVRRFRHTIKIKERTYPVRSVRRNKNGKCKVSGLILNKKDIIEETLELIGVIKTYKRKG